MQYILDYNLWSGHELYYTTQMSALCDELSSANNLGVPTVVIWARLKFWYPPDATQRFAHPYQCFYIQPPIRGFPKMVVSPKSSILIRFIFHCKPLLTIINHCKPLQTVHFGYHHFRKPPYVYHPCPFSAKGPRRPSGSIDPDGYRDRWCLPVGCWLIEPIRIH